MAKKKKEEAIKAPESWINELDFNNLFTIKHYPKTVFCVCTKPNKSGMIQMQEFLTPKKKYYKTKDVMPLMRLAFYQQSGEVLDIKEVFKNIDKNIDEILKQDVNADAMELIVPSYDSTKFKENHCQKLCDWFGVIKGRYAMFVAANQVEETKEKELTIKE